MRIIEDDFIFILIEVSSELHEFSNCDMNVSWFMEMVVVVLNQISYFGEHKWIWFFTISFVQIKESVVYFKKPSAHCV